MSGQPWFTVLLIRLGPSRRDTVVQVTTKTRPQRISNYDESQPKGAPLVDGVVRIEQSQIYFHLTRVDDQHTRLNTA